MVSIPASGSSLHCVGYGSVLCSAYQQTMLGLGPPLAGQSRTFGPSSRILFVASV